MCDLPGVHGYLVGYSESSFNSWFEQEFIICKSVCCKNLGLNNFYNSENYNQD